MPYTRERGSTQHHHQPHNYEEKRFSDQICNIQYGKFVKTCLHVSPALMLSVVQSKKIKLITRAMWQHI